MQLDLANGAAMWMCLVVLLSFHEYAHAWMAHKCGDDTARMMGRMTINPIVHIDPIGTVFLPLMMLLPINPGCRIIWLGQAGASEPVKSSIEKRDDILISMAGPAMNVILAIVILAVLRLAIEMPEGISKSAIVAELPESHSSACSFVCSTSSRFRLWMARMSCDTWWACQRKLIGISHDLVYHCLGRDQHPRRNFIHR